MVRATIKEERCPMNDRRNRVKYTKEFKEDAINLVIEQGYSANEAGRRLGINQSNISRWVREYRRDQEELAEGGVPRKELEAEIRRLKKENQRLEMEREILKKAAAFFAKESSWDTTLSGSKRRPIPSPCCAGWWKLAGADFTIIVVITTAELRIPNRAP